MDIDTDTGEVFPAHSTEYMDGYEHCRQQVIAILSEPVARRKSEIVELINALKP
jgi:hypothetical protein